MNGSFRTEIIAEYKMRQVDLKAAGKLLHEVMRVIPIHAQVMKQAGLVLENFCGYTGKARDALLYFIGDAGCIHSSLAVLLVFQLVRLV